MQETPRWNIEKCHSGCKHRAIHLLGFKWYIKSVSKILLSIHSVSCINLQPPVPNHPLPSARTSTATQSTENREQLNSACKLSQHLDLTLVPLTRGFDDIMCIVKPDQSLWRKGGFETAVNCLCLFPRLLYKLCRGSLSRYLQSTYTGIHACWPLYLGFHKHAVCWAFTQNSSVSFLLSTVQAHQIAITDINKNDKSIFCATKIYIS